MDRHSIEKVLERIEIFDTTLVDDWVMCRCPFAPWKHDHGTDRRLGFGIHIEEDGVSFINCFTCHTKGSVSSMVSQLAGLLEDDKLKKYAKQLEQDEILGTSNEIGEWDDTQHIKKKADYRVTNYPDPATFARYPTPFAEPRAVEYLRRRHVSYSTVIKTGLRYDARQRRILFPVYTFGGKYTGCSGRSILSDKEIAARNQDRPGIYPKIRDYAGLQKDRVLLFNRGIRFGWCAIPRTRNNWKIPPRENANFVIVVEGLFAYTRMVELGFGSNTYALLGSAVTPGKADLLLKLDLPVYWFVDNDAAGKACLFGPYDVENAKHKLEQGALHRFYGKLPQFVVTWPEGKTDPDELSYDNVIQMISEAEMYIQPDLTMPKRRAIHKPSS